MTTYEIVETYQTSPEFSLHPCTWLLVFAGMGGTLDGEKDREIDHPCNKHIPCHSRGLDSNSFLQKGCFKLPAGK
jgi:hypothetical protein